MRDRARQSKTEQEKQSARGCYNMLLPFHRFIFFLLPVCFYFLFVFHRLFHQLVRISIGPVAFFCIQSARHKLFKSIIKFDFHFDSGISTADVYLARVCVLVYVFVCVCYNQRRYWTTAIINFAPNKHKLTTTEYTRKKIGNKYTAGKNDKNKHLTNYIMILMAAEKKGTQMKSRKHNYYRRCSVRAFLAFHNAPAYNTLCGRCGQRNQRAQSERHTASA